MRVRVKDIAQANNVSSATVSLVLNNKPGVKEETRNKILEYAGRFGYDLTPFKKNALAKSGTILFVVYKKHGRVVMDTPFFSQVIAGIESETRSNGFGLSILYIDTECTFEETSRRIANYAPKGIILLATEMDRDDIRHFTTLSIPLVVLDNNSRGIKVDTIGIDNVGGAYEATSYLIKMGHTRIGYLHSAVDISNFNERKLGYREALSVRQLNCDEREIYKLDPTQEGAYMDMSRVLRKSAPLPTAFFCDNDIIATGAVKALKETGKKVPEEISVVGFDNMPFSNIIEPALTTVGVFKQKMGILAVRRLIYRIETNPEEFVNIVVGTDLIIRKSVEKPL